MPTLTTARLALRELTEADGPFMLRLLNEPAYLRFIGDRGVRSVEDAQRYLRDGPMQSYARHGFGLYMVELKDSRLPLGICGLIKRESLEDVDIGFAFLPEHWSQGYAFESAAAVVQHGRTALGLRRIVAIVDPANERSVGLLGRLGLRFERMMTWPEDGTQLKLYGVSFKNE